MLSLCPCRGLLAAGAFALTTLVARGAVFTWSGGDGAWSAGANWAGMLAPVSGATNDLVFGGATAFTATNDLPAPFALNSITFTSSAATVVQLTGSQIETLTDAGVTPVFTQSGSGAVQIANDLLLTQQLTLTGAGAGQVALNGLLSGGAQMAGVSWLNLTGGSWQLSNPGSTYLGTTTVRTGARLELFGVANLSIDAAPASVVGNSSDPNMNRLTINGGTLKLTTTGSISLGATRPIVFAGNGGVLDLTNSNFAMPDAHAGFIASGDLMLQLNNTLAAVAVVRFNGGQLGYSDYGAPLTGKWTTEANVLRFANFNSASPDRAVRIELTNGAMLRSGTGGGATVTQHFAVRGVPGGDPTSGPLGQGNSGTTRETGRFVVDNADETTYSGSLTFQGAMQVGAVGRSRALNGNLTIAGTGSGFAGYVAFTGRGTGSQLTDTVNAPGIAGNAQSPLWLLRGGVGSLTIEDGGVAVFDVHQRTDGDAPNGNGVALDGLAVIKGGGELRLAQSTSYYTPGTALSEGNAGDHLIYGDIRGEGTSAKEALLTLALPAPVPGANFASTIPFTLTTTPTTTPLAEPGNFRPYGGARFDDSRGQADFIVNGSGLGGLKIASVPRPAALFEPAHATSDPVPGVAKVNAVLTPERLARLSGTGGYLTVATPGETWPFPSGGEWAAAVPVGLKITDHHLGGVDVDFSALTAFAHPLVVESGATLALGAGPFTYGPGLLQGAGTITGPLTLAGGATVAPGPGAATLTTGDATFLDGVTLSLELNAAQSDQLAVLGALTLGGALNLNLTLGFDPVDFSDVFTLVANDGADAVQGPGLLRSGGVPLAQDAVFAVTTGPITQHFRLSYTGGDGNDVTAAAVPEPRAFVFTAATLAALLFTRPSCAARSARRRCGCGSTRSFPPRRNTT